jgi:hypothetical protein
MLCNQAADASYHAVHVYSSALTCGVLPVAQIVSGSRLTAIIEGYLCTSTNFLDCQFIPALRVPASNPIARCQASLCACPPYTNSAATTDARALSFMSQPRSRRFTSHPDVNALCCRSVIP